MSQPAVLITVLDNQLGVLPASSGRLPCFVGPCHGGPVDTPSTYGTVKALVADFVGGAAVHLAAHMIEKYGRPVCIVRTADSVDGGWFPQDAEDGESTLDLTDFEGTSTVTVSVDTPDAAYEDIVVRFATGSDVGVAGAVYQISLDGGDSYSLATPLGTATTIDLGVGVTLSFTAGGDTIEDGDEIHVSTTAPIIDTTGTFATTLDGAGGKSTATIDETTNPNDDYELMVKFENDGTIGVDGIEYRESRDGGRNYTAPKALGTATSIVVADTGGAKFDLAAGDVEAGDTIYAQTFGPKWNTASLGAALDALKNSAVVGEMVRPVGALDGDAFDTVDTKVQAMAAAGKYRYWEGDFRMPTGSESAAAYLTAFNAAFSAKASTWGAVSAGACEMTSSVNGLRLRRPFGWASSALGASVTAPVNIADTNIGSLSVTLTDANGNPKHHDESINPGLDDSRAVVARTFENIAGVYVNRHRLFSAEGSDFQLVPHRRVMNLGLESLRLYFLRRLNTRVFVNKTTGFILEEEAQEIEAGALAAMAGYGLDGGANASGALFTLNRNDNLLSTKTLTGQARIIPFGYIEYVNLDIGFFNPSLQLA